MATTFEVMVEARSREYAESAAGAVFAEVDRLEEALSRFIPSSDIARLNALRSDQALLLGIEATECLQMAREVWQETDGAFDVTVGRLLPSPANDPTGDQVPVGMSLLGLDARKRIAWPKTPGVVVDLGAIGKGYAVDRAIEVLADWGITRGLVHAGQSSVFALGEGIGPDAKDSVGGWCVPLRNPCDPLLAVGEVLLRDASLGGSGRLLHGEHILDPRTRTPCRAETLAAWAVSRSAALSDAYSTAFMIMTPAQVEACCLRQPDLSGILLLRSADRFEIRRYGSAAARVSAPEVS
ncbi:MAG: FAD:protein FMN transferase [Phycisphaerales bacterium]|nr:FAD:protein FMN transferase [Phycisphaerales bacterium]